MRIQTRHIEKSLDIHLFVASLKDLPQGVQNSQTSQTILNIVEDRFWISSFHEVEEEHVVTGNICATIENFYKNRIEESK